MRYSLPSVKSLLRLTVFNAMTLPSGEEQKEKVVPHKSILDVERFGMAPEDLRRPLLAGRKGKGTRKQRKALNAKSNVISDRQAVVALAMFNEYVAQYHN